MRRLNLSAALLVTALLVTACTSKTHATSSSNARSTPVTTVNASSSNESATATRDPQVLIDALDAAGLALCHSDYNDGAQFNIYGILGATVIWRGFPYHSAVPVPGGSANVLTCLSTNQLNTGDIEIDVYWSDADASSALRQLGRIWLDAWLFGNIAVLVDRTTPLPIALEEYEVLDHVAGTTQVS